MMEKKFMPRDSESEKKGGEKERKTEEKKSTSELKLIRKIHIFPYSYR